MTNHQHDDARDHQCRADSAAEHDERPNVLLTPPCDCPRCAPERWYDHTATADDGWLRLPGHEQRYRVELVRLGTTGRAVLG